MKCVCGHPEVAHAGLGCPVSPKGECRNILWPPSPEPGEKDVCPCKQFEAVRED